MSTRLPQRYDLTCYRGQSFCQNLRFKKKEIDPETGKEILVTFPLTDYIAKAEIRPSENSTILISEITANVTAADGMISLALTQEQTAAIAAGLYVWDLYTVHDWQKKYWIKGNFIMTGRVTE